MADIRIKDLTTTASQTSSGDFIAIDGLSNGTRKLSATAPAFLTSVTTPSLTAPAATDLTLAGGSSGASLVLGQGTGYAVATSTDTGTAGEQIALVASATTSGTPTAGYGPSLRFFRKGNDGGAAGSAASVRAVAITGTGSSQYNSNLTLAARLAGNMVDVLTATGAGTVSIPSSTAGSANTGALVVTGGLSAGNNGGTSYFGGAVTVSLTNPEVAIRSTSDAAAQRQYLTFGSPNYNRAQFQSVSAGANDGSLELRTFNAGAQTLTQTWNKDGSSTFAGAVTVSSSTAGSSGAGALVVTGGLSAGGDSFVGGSKLLTQKDQNAPTRLQVRNDTNGTGAQAQVSATLGDFTTYTAMGSLAAAFTTSGLFAANTGYIASNATAGLNIFTVDSTPLILGTNNTTRLTIAGTGAATFAGAVTIAGTVIHTLSATPASASATGTVGTMSWDASYIYICTATNTWKRVAIATW